jgi:putative membrane protein
MSKTNPLLLMFMLLATFVGLVASGWQPYDRATWLMEVMPVLIAVPVLWATHQKFPLTTLLYWCIFFHALVLILGGTYTYARVPLGFVVQDWLELSRNPYDKLGHFFQGFVPALVAREILIRHKIINGTRMLTLIILCVVLAISAAYELIEWAAALMLGQGADEFLGTQGDPWDTQSDMFFAFVGAVTALFFLSKVHSSQIKNIGNILPNNAE